MIPAADLRSIQEIAPLVARGEVSPMDLVRRCLVRIEHGRELNAFITVMAESAMAEAEAAASEIAGGHYRGPLHGIPVSVKDLIDVAGVPTTSGSAVPALRPSTDALIVRKLRAAGAVIIGKTNLHEFAFGTTSDETAFGTVLNPFDRSRSAGGSSSGAAVALVEGMCYGSIGTDTGGSIRIPAAACGVVGLKPTYGELSCEGIVPLSTSCDHVGPMARTVGDAQLMFQALTAPADAGSIGSRFLTLGIPCGYLFDRLDGEVRRAFERVRAALERAGHATQRVEIPRVETTPDVYLHTVLPEASHYHATMLSRYPGAYSPGVRLRLEMGRYMLAEDHVRALRLGGVLTAGVDRALEGCDGLLLPALAIPAPLLGTSTVEIDGAIEPVRAAMLRLTQLFNITGHPAIAIPAGCTPAGLPVGVQLVGRRHETPGLLALAGVVERHITGAGSVGGGTG